MTVYVDPAQDQALKALRERTGIPMAVLIRDAIDVGLMRWTDNTDPLLARVEQDLEEAKAQAERELRDLGPMQTDLDLVTTHARQLQLERDEARALVQRYRAVLRGVHGTLSEALSPSSGVLEP